MKGGTRREFHRANVYAAAFCSRTRAETRPATAATVLEQALKLSPNCYTFNRMELNVTTRICRGEFESAEIGAKLVLMNANKGNYVGLDEVCAALWQCLEAPL